MISPEEALHIILDRSIDFGIEEVSFLKAQNRVLKEDILADRDLPPFNRVSMDGIAINYDAFKKGIRNFSIEGIQAAGSVQLHLNDPDHCLEVMTGAVLPENTDTVIRYEDVTINEGGATINLETVEKSQNVHHKGKDRKLNDILIRKNTLISAAEIGILSTVGKSNVKVA
ncbi:MAG: molybdopterin molybdenumtransferase MoeA, partial [Flavobacteriaceae bacterium]|nr:molybdopterin molybdenumtransferase MoeA [Flavobacteriaceae bacterium]